MSKTDNELKKDIEDELRFDPTLNAAQIGVTVDHGAVSLLGEVDTYAQKSAAEEATKRVGGVRIVAQDLTVKVLEEHKRTDVEIAGALQIALNWNVSIPKTVTATVVNGFVTLQGIAQWNYQREAAVRAIEFLTGVVGIINQIELQPPISTDQVKEKIEAALQRQAKADTNSIKINASGGRVTLTGKASSWQSIEDAANAAWAAPGVTEVSDQIKMVMTY